MEKKSGPLMRYKNQGHGVNKVSMKWLTRPARRASASVCPAEGGNQADRRLAAPGVLDELAQPRRGDGGQADAQPLTRFPHSSGSNAAGSSATQPPASRGSVNTCSSSPPGGTVTKILPRTRNDAISKCGSSVTSGRDRANRRACARSLIRTAYLPAPPASFHGSWLLLHLFCPLCGHRIRGKSAPGPGPGPGPID